MGSIGFPKKRTYRIEGGQLLRGTAVIQGTADDQVKAPAAANAKGIGVLEETIAQDKHGAVIKGGESIAIAGGAIVAGELVKIGGANGRMIAGVDPPAATTTENYVGRAVTGAAADGDEFILDVAPFVNTGT